MERKQKTYQATQSIQLDTYALVDGQAVLIEFRGGTMDPRKNGIYLTSNPKIIAALDADIKRVGEDRSTFKCIHEEVLVDDEPVTEPIAQKTIPDIKTVTAARQWLIDASEAGIIKKGITPSIIKNRTDVFKIAEENNVIFADLPQSG